MMRQFLKDSRLAASIFLLAGLTFSPIFVECYKNDLVYADDPAPVVNTPTISIPKELQGVVGQFIEIPATTNGTEVKWAVLNQQGLNLFPMDLLKDTKTAVAVANKDGIYYLHAWTALNNIPSDLSTCKITIGNPVPPQPNPPGPNPPGPNPPQPTPVNPTKLSVLFVDEHSDYGTDNYKSYLGVINSTKVRAYLNAHCNSEAFGNANVPTWRKWDQNTDISKESSTWQKLFSVKRDTLPWLIVADSQGNIFYSGKVPASESDTLALLQKYGGQ